MASPILLVADDLAIIASVKRVLAREGYEIVLATSAADAVIAFSHHLPGLVVLQPTVERDRGGVVLEELQLHPESQLLRVVQLGEAVPGFAFPVEPLPLDGAHFAQTVNGLVRGADPKDTWSMVERNKQPAAPAPTSKAEADPWRATSPPEVSGDASSSDLSDPTLEPQAVDRPQTPVPQRLEKSLFGDLPSLEDEMGADVEAQALASLESSLPQAAPAVTDDELTHLEAAVRAEAARRRQATEAAVGLTPETPAPEKKEDPAAEASSDEADFGDLGEPATPPPQQAPTPPPEAVTPPPVEDPLQRAEAMLAAARTVTAEQAQREDAAKYALRRHALEVEQSLEAERTAKSALEEDVEQWRTEAQRLEQELGGHVAQSAQALAEAHQLGHEAQLSLEVEQQARIDLEQQVATLNDELSREQAAREQLEARAVELEPLAAQLQQELDGLREALAAEQAARATAENRVADLEADIDAARALGLSRSESAAALELELTNTKQRLDEALEQLPKLEDKLTELHAELHTARTEKEALEEAVAQLRHESTQRQARVDELTEETATLRNDVEQLEQTNKALVEDKQTLEAARAEQEAEANFMAGRVETVEERLASERAMVEELKRSLADFEKNNESHLRTRTLLERESQTLTTRLEAAEKANEEQRALLEQHTLTALASEELKARTEALEKSLAEERERAERLNLELADAGSARDSLRRQLEAATEETSAIHEQLKSLATERESLRGELERTTAELTHSRERATSFIDELARLRTDLEEERVRAESAEATAELAAGKVHELEHRAVMPLALPGKQTLGVPRTGTVTLETLSRLVAQLVLANAETRLELGIAGGTRVVWLKRGHVIAAESTLPYESLIDRARRDGLIDARQEAELRMVRGATAREQLEVLKARGFIREIETVPLVQRYTEFVALEAFTEPTSQYRLSEDPPPETTLAATVPRSTLPMVAEGLRRALPADALLELLGGGEGVPVPLESELDLRALGFSERERKMLSWADGAATVEDLSLASGLKPDAAFRSMLVAKLLGAIDVKPAARTMPKVSMELDVRRLEAKYDEVQDADYFSILGLPRSAGNDEVQRAYERLSAEFDPIKYSGHSDPSLQQRAQVVSDLIEEAARALTDDRRRVEYARHLLD